jgi:hypothetical protein
LSFDAESIRIGEIGELQAYGGKRIGLLARLDTAVIPLQIDLAFGDVVTPDASWLTYPTLLPFPNPYLQAYPKEIVVVEKLHAMVTLCHHPDRRLPMSSPSGQPGQSKVPGK